MKRVIVELRVSLGVTMDTIMEMDAVQLPGFTLDPDYEPVPVSPPEELAASLADANEEVVLIRGEVDEEKEEELRAQPNVIGVWTDAEVEAFEEAYLEETEAGFGELEEEFEVGPMPGEIPAFDLETASPCPPTDCASSTAKGTIADVAKYLQCDRLWAKGIRGQGVVIGICDSGVNKTKVPAVIGGWSPIPGYTPGTAPASSHGTMCATDAVGMCPEAKILDIAILKSAAPTASGFLSDCIAAFQWALTQYKKNKTPQILSNSWGLYQKSKAPDYAIKPDHPFTKKVVEVINAGIVVTFAAGNCGSQCPSWKCGSDTGPGSSIWGANGHPRVITVGAANILEQWIGYTSQGPAALDPEKPDFCAPSHFKGATSCDNGTSAANPVCAGVIGLLKSHDPSLTQDKVKEALQKSAKNLCAPGWDPNSGYGMIQAFGAYRYLFEPRVVLAHAMWIHGTSIHEQYPENLKTTRRGGPYTLYEGKPNTRNWFHFAIPTPVIVSGRPLRLDSVMLNFYTTPDVWVTSVHIYDGGRRIESYDGLSLTGSHWFERWDVLNKYVRRGVGISIGVRFGTDEAERHYIGFFSAGADFIA